MIRALFFLLSKKTFVKNILLKGVPSSTNNRQPFHKKVFSCGGVEQKHIVIEIDKMLCQIGNGVEFGLYASRIKYGEVVLLVFEYRFVIYQYNGGILIVV